jgi:hypothetical protein
VEVIEVALVLLGDLFLRGVWPGHGCENKKCVSQKLFAKKRRAFL